MDAAQAAGKIFRSALESVDPYRITGDYAGKIVSYASMNKFKEIVVAGFGKAAFRMAEAVEDALPRDLLSEGIVVTKYGHAGKKGAAVSALKKIKVFEAGHPVPDEHGIEATGEIINLLRRCDESTLVVCLVSGGGSALFVSPYEGISLKEKQDITDLLLRSGADITELNAVRKHLSRVKGGRLAGVVYPAEIISLMISDVIGDKPDVIASGPTAPDPSTWKDALDVVMKYGLSERAPAAVSGLLKRGSDGLLPDTPKEGNRIFERVQNIIIGSNGTAVEAAKNQALALGFIPEVLSTAISGEAAEVGRWLAGKARDHRSRRRHGVDAADCLISGGETTVHVRGKGKGGRNTELALSFAMEIDGADGITMLSAGTDGTDGPTDAAGAIVDGGTTAKAGQLGLDAQRYLDNNDSYNFFKKTGSLLITGPTGTNVMDIQIVIIE